MKKNLIVFIVTSIVWLLLAWRFVEMTEYFDKHFGIMSLALLLLVVLSLVPCYYCLLWRYDEDHD